MKPSDISKRSRSDHKALLRLLDALLRDLGSFTTRIRTGKVSFTYYGDVFQFANAQLDLMESARLLCLTGRYRAGFVCIRTILEHFFELRLIGEAQRYALPVRFPKNHKEDLATAKARLEKEIEDVRRKGRKDILGVRVLEGKLYMVFEGLFMKDARSKKERIPYYYNVLHTFDPNHAYLPRELLKRDWSFDRKHAIAEAARLSHRMKEQHDLMNVFMKFGRIMFHCGINGFLRGKEKHRAQVHYNFLSQFVHPTLAGTEKIRPRSGRVSYISSLEEMREYRYILCHLQLLYLAFMAVMYEESLIRMVKKAPAQYMGGVDSRRFERLRTTLLDQFGYFWFIYHGRPSDITKFHHASHRLWAGRKVPLLSQIPDGKVSYYLDPIEFLKELSGSWKNPVLGEVRGPLYGSPVHPFF